MPTRKNLLTITELGEISFVDKGDNPPAGAVILKSAPPTPGETVAEQNDVQKRIDEAVAAEVAKRTALEERIAKMEEAEAFAKVEDSLKSAGLDVAKLAKPIHAIRKAAPEAAVVVEAELERLAKGMDAAVRLGGGQIAGVGKSTGTDSATALKQFNDLVAKAESEGMPYTVALTKVAHENPELYRAAGA